MILLIVALYQDKKACEFYEEMYKKNLERQNIIEVINFSLVVNASFP